MSEAEQVTNKMTEALLTTLAREYKRESMFSFVSMVICDAADQLPVSARDSFWKSWEEARDNK